jgi:uncharacterized DUF497 family protein
MCASMVFTLRPPHSCYDDPHALTQRDDSIEKEERWITLGTVGASAVLLVVHMYTEEHGDETICVISARVAGIPRKEGL